MNLTQTQNNYIKMILNLLKKSSKSHKNKGQILKNENEKSHEKIKNHQKNINLSDFIQFKFK